MNSRPARHYRTPSAAVSVIEPLEARQLLSITAPTVTAKQAAHLLKAEGLHKRHTKLPFNDLVAYADGPVKSPASTKGGTKAQTTYSPVVGAYSPIQVRTAYGVTALATTNQGQGTTIGIVDEFDDPNIIGDANIFSSQYGLPTFNSTGNPTLTVYKDQALATVTSAAGTGVALETSLDVEWAHAMAPDANILLVEVPATGSVANQFAELLHGVQYAAAQPNVVAVSLSYGDGESSIGASSVTSQNSTYLASGAATKTVVAVSSGDGSSPLYPATSPNVVAVGGTSLYLASVKGKYAYETAWGGLSGEGAGGGGLSTNFGAPTFQSSHGVTYAKRAIPDVAMIADPVTGVSVYDSLDVSTQYPDPWQVVGGTSLASPVFAGMVSLAQQTRLAAGKAILTSAQVDSEIYAVYNSVSYANYFHDVTLGSNKNVNSSGSTTVAGYATTTGYDQATGVGSPIGNTFVPLLASL